VRARLRSLYVGACEELASLLERRGDSTGVLGVLVKALEADPYPEDIQRRVMVLRLRSARNAAWVAGLSCLKYKESAS